MKDLSNVWFRFCTRVLRLGLRCIDNFICKIANTYVEEAMLNGNDKVDYNKLKPVLFEMPTSSYLKTGEMIGKCTLLGKEYREEQGK